MALTVAVFAAGLCGLDQALASRMIPSSLLTATVHVLELTTLKSVSEFIVPALLIVSGCVAWRLGRSKVGRSLIYIGLVTLVAYFASDLSKPLFGRWRPFEAAGAGVPDRWFMSGNSFPSGHVSFFGGLSVAAVVVAPRAWPLLAIPLLVAAQRVTAGDHYLSDVAASFVLVLLAAAILLPLAKAERAPLLRKA